MCAPLISRARQVKLVTFGVRAAAMKMVMDDLSIVRVISTYDNALLAISTQQFAL